VRTIKIILCGIIFIMCVSCEKKNGELPMNTFDSPFIKRNISLKKLLGEELLLKTWYGDSLHLKIFTNKKINLITEKNTGDTLFFGTVSKYKGLYYFNQQLNDSSYRIHAVKINDNIIYGLSGGWYQTYLIDEEVLTGKYNKIVKYIDTINNVIRLHPDKKEFKKFFASVLSKIDPDTIITNSKTEHVHSTDTSEVDVQIDPEEFEFLRNVYPNPTSDLINIELQQKNVLYHLTDLNGRIIYKGEFIDSKNEINLNNQPNGIYMLTLIEPSGEQMETIKILKTE
jgi:hypothetical protein